MKKSGLQFLTISILILGMIGCDHSGIFVEYKTIPRATWNRDSIIVFQIPVKDTIKNYNLLINVRNDINYKYSNLWLFVGIIQPDDSTTVTDTVEITLADQTGKWLGHGFGGVKTNETLFKSNVYFPVKGDYIIKIQHGMRGKELDGITEIGFTVENP